MEEYEFFKQILITFLLMCSIIIIGLNIFFSFIVFSQSEEDTNDIIQNMKNDFKNKKLIDVVIFAIMVTIIPLTIKKMYHKIKRMINRS